MKIAADRLVRHAVTGLLARAVPQGDAVTVAECLIDADLEGQASHGMLRLPFLLRRLDSGLINPRPRITIVESRPATALIDGDNALGPVAGVAALDATVTKARTAGSATVTVRRSNHLGSMGFYVKRGSSQGLITFGFSNTPPAMAPPGGRTAFLGTNPIACGIPTSGAPVVVDMATSQVARGRILKAAAAGTPIPVGWALDPEGRPTVEPGEALAGSLVPLGGAKGFALALVVEVLTGVLAGAGVGPDVAGTFDVSTRPSDVGHCFFAIDPDAFGSGFRSRMDRLSHAIRQIPPTDPAQPVRMPGDRRIQERADRQRDGIEISENLARELGGLVGEALV